MSKAITMTEAEIAYIPRVEHTQTWRPVHHSEVIEAMDRVLAGMGLEAEAKQYEVSQNGKDCFANLRLPVEAGGVQPHNSKMLLGWRNSMQKYFALGIVGGDHIMNCSNMQFYGEFQESRKHTSGLNWSELVRFLTRAIAEIFARGVEYRGWFQNLAGAPLPEQDRKILTFDMMERGILTPSHFRRLQDAYAEELRSNRQGGVESYAHLHGAVTRVLRDMPLSNIQERTLALNGLIQERLQAEDEGDVIEMIHE